MASLPPPSELNASNLPSVLDSLFEPSPTLHSLFLASLPSLPNPPFSTYPELCDHVASLLFNLQSTNSPQLLPILGAHPRLGAKKVDSAASQEEQKSLQAKSEEEGEKLRRLNEEYEERFPGMRYVVFVNGREREVIMQDMRRRIDRGDLQAEIKEAIEAMRDIAKDRAGKMGIAKL